MTSREANGIYGNNGSYGTKGAAQMGVEPGTFRRPIS